MTVQKLIANVSQTNCENGIRAIRAASKNLIDKREKWTLKVSLIKDLFTHFGFGTKAVVPDLDIGIENSMKRYSWYLQDTQH